LLLVKLGEGDDPGRWLVVAAARGFVEAEGLESSREGEEEEGGRDEDADVEMDLASGFEDLVGRSHKDRV
jgi:hypothetical protein